MPKFFDYNHILLYAKYHYRMEDPVKDLQTIIGKICWIEPDGIPVKDICNILCGLVYPHFKQESHFTDLVMHLLAAKDDGEKIWAFLSFLGNVQVRETDPVTKEEKVVLNLGQADPDMLPLRRDTQPVPNKN